MKKIISIALAILLIFILASCNSDNTNKSAATEKAAASAEVQEEADNGSLKADDVIGTWGTPDSGDLYIEFREDYTWTVPGSEQIFDDEGNPVETEAGKWEIRDGKIVAYYDGGETTYEYVSEDGKEKIVADHGWEGYRLSDDGEIITLMIEQLRAGNLSEAQAYNLKLPETARDYTVGTLTDEMRSAYKDIVRNADAFTDYWLCDADNDGNAELLLNLGPDSASAITHIYKYEDGKATEIGEISGNVTCHAYPANNGIITEFGKQGLNKLSLVTFENGQVKEEELAELEAAPGEEYFNMRNTLKSHAEWSDDKYVPIFDDLD